MLVLRFILESPAANTLSGLPASKGCSLFFFRAGEPSILTNWRLDRAWEPEESRFPDENGKSLPSKK